MHILILPAWYPSDDNPVNGSFFREQAIALSKSGTDISVFTLRDIAGERPHVKTSIDGLVKQYDIIYHSIPFHLTYFVILWQMVRLICEMKRSGSMPDLVHVHSYKQARYARALQHLFKLPYVVTEHVTWFERKIISEKTLKIIQRDYERAAAVFAVSDGLKEQIQYLCTNKEIKVIPNLVSDSFFESPSAPAEIPPFRFLSVGTLNYKKGMDVLIKAFSNVHKCSPEVRLTICGEGPDLSALMKMTAELGIADKVEFTGRVSREEVSNRMKQSHVFVLPSRTETFGVVFIEAMASGRPILMTKTNAWETILRPNCGVAVDIDDVDSLTNEMLCIMKDYSSYDPSYISDSCRNYFSESIVCEKLKREYGLILERNA